MSIKVEGFSGALAEVDSDHNLQVNLPTAQQQAGFVRILDGEGSEILNTESGALRTSSDSLIFFEQVDGVALNTNLWLTSVSGMTIAQASGFITLNSGAAITANAYAILSSIKSIPMYGHLPLRIGFNAKVTIQPQSNFAIEIGLGSVATNAAPTDGAFFRWTAQGEFRAVINNGGTEVASSPLLTFTGDDGTPVILPPVSNEVTLFEIIIVEDLVRFLVDDEIVAEVDVPPGLAFPTNSGRLPLFARAYNSGSVPAQAPQLSIGQVVVVQQDINQSKMWGETLAVLGRGAYQSPVTAFGQTANHANSTSPVSATLSNTVAGYTTFGGRFQFAAVGGAATDFALFAFQVPAGYQLFLTGISISVVNTGAAVATTATILDWSIGVNASAVSLATADGAGAWAPRRIPLGIQAFQVSDPIGQAARNGDLVRSFAPNLVVDGGRYVHVILQMPVGTATGSQIIRGDVTLTGYFE